MKFNNDICNIKNEIKEMVNNTYDIDLLCDIKKQMKQKPLHISEFIVEMFEKNYNSDDVYCNNDVMYAFEHTIRKICMELKYNVCTGEFKGLRPASEYIEHWSELDVIVKNYNLELDLWISEQGYLFDARELAWVIYNIYCGKVTFKI